MATMLDGKALAQKIKDALKLEVAQLKAKTSRAPRMVNILIGEDASACAYANSQKKVAEYVGIEYALETLALNVTQEDLLRTIHRLNNDSKVSGMMVHKPIPAQIDYTMAVNAINPSKDLEGLNVTNFGKLISGETKIIPCTPAAAMELIKSTGVSLKGKEAVVVGRSEIVGKPMSLLLLKEDATVTVCHSGTSKAGKLEEHIGRADILVAAIGKPFFVKGEWIKKGAIVIDVGINSVDGKIVGDVEFETAKERAQFITPVPGGVGPVTVVMLMRNCIEGYKTQSTIKGS